MGEWAYIPGEGIWRYAPQSNRWEGYLAWCPRVVDSVRYTDMSGGTITRSFKIEVDGQVEVISAGDLHRQTAWQRFPAAARYSGRPIADVLINAVTDQASQLPDVIGRPHFDSDSGRLVLPPTEYLADGYTNGEGSTLAALAALVAGIAPYPVAALQLALAAGGPWVTALGLQPFTFGIVGDSTVGKSTGLYAAASLWGTPYRHVGAAWAGTKLGILGGFRDLGVLPAFRDELGSAGLAPADRAHLFTGIMEGATRTARTRDDLPRPSASWGSVCLSTSNIAHVPASVASAGTPKGVIEIHADSSHPVIPPAAKAPIIALTNAPEAAGAWVPYATALTLDQVRHHYGLAAKVLGEPPADGLKWHMHRAMSLGLAFARLLADLTGVPALAESAELAARAVIDTTEERAAEMGADHGARLVEALAELLAIRPAAFGIGVGPYGPNIDQIGFMYQTAEGTELVCIFPTRHIELEKLSGVEDARTAQRQLRETGYLRASPKRGLRYMARPAAGKPPMPVYAYDLNPPAPGPVVDIPAQDPAPAAEPGHGAQAAAAVPPAETSWGPGTIGAAINAEPILAAVPAPAPEHQAAPAAGPAQGPSAAWEEPPLPEPPEEYEAAAPVPIPRGQQRQQPRTYPPRAERQPAPRDDRLAAFTRAARLHFPEATAADISPALDLYEHKLNGTRFEESAGITGIIMFHRLMEMHGSVPQLEKVSTLDLVGERGRHPDALKIQRAFNAVIPAALGPDAAWLYGTDVNAQYLAAGGSVELGCGQPERLGQFTREHLKLPGYAQLVTAGMPAPFTAIRPGEWVPMPMVKLAFEWAAQGRCPEPQVTEVIVWPKHRRWFRLLCRDLGAGRAALLDRQDVPGRIALDVIKQTYSKTLGGMVRSERHNRTAMLRPDWGDMVRATATANMWRALAGATPGPVAVLNTDAAYFAMPAEGQQPDGLIFSSQPGKWKPGRQCPVTAELRTAIESRHRDISKLIRDGGISK